MGTLVKNVKRPLRKTQEIEKEWAESQQALVGRGVREHASLGNFEI